jgi:hypothetical protein
MDLWSKGLGRLVLTMRLNERDDEMVIEDQDLVMRGTMGKPTFWDWSVTIGEIDVVDFLIFLRQPEPIRYMVASDNRWSMLRVALRGGVIFAARTIGLFLGLVPTADTTLQSPEINDSEPAAAAAGKEKQ